MKDQISPRFLFVCSAVVLATLTRFLPHPPNFTAIGAIALFAGVYMPKKWMSLLIPAAAMFLSDLAFGLHNTMWAVYLAFGITTAIGWFVRRNTNFLTVTSAAVVSSVIFFFITNAAMWVVGFWAPVKFYSTSAAGLGEAIMAGIPFYANSLISQLLYTAVLFGSLHYAVKLKPSLAKA